MAASIGSHGTSRFFGPDLPKPTCVVLLYTGHSDVGAVEPPTFVAVGDEEGIAPAATTGRRVAALRSLGTDVEYRKFKDVGHGFGLGTGTTADGWIEDAVRFWTRQIKR
jgi:predicted esterase